MRETCVGLDEMQNLNGLFRWILWNNEEISKYLLIASQVQENQDRKLYFQNSHKDWY